MCCVVSNFYFISFSKTENHFSGFCRGNKSRQEQTDAASKKQKSRALQQGTTGTHGTTSHSTREKGTTKNHNTQRRSGPCGQTGIRATRHATRRPQRAADTDSESRDQNRTAGNNRKQHQAQTRDQTTAEHTTGRRDAGTPAQHTTGPHKTCHQTQNREEPPNKPQAAPQGTTAPHPRTPHQNRKQGMNNSNTATKRTTQHNTGRHHTGRDTAQTATDQYRTT